VLRRDVSRLIAGVLVKLTGLFAIGHLLMVHRHSPIPSVEHAHEFFEILGRCITAWSHIDDELFRIFMECVGPPEQCSIIFSVCRA
jgi:hypothetical protein